MEANNKAMREALGMAKKAICHHARVSHTCDSLAWENSTINANCADILCGHRDLCEAKTAIQKALAKPPRNCDVYDPEEMVRRHNSYCGNSRESFSCINSPASSSKKCFAKWAQAPYEERGAK